MALTINKKEKNHKWSHLGNENRKPKTFTVHLHLSDDGVVLPDPLVLWLLFDGVCGGELHSFAVTAQNGLAPADIRGLQGEAAAVLAGSHRVVSDVTQSC